MLEGSNMQPYACNMNGKFVVAAIAGREVPVVVSTAASAGTLLKVGTAPVGAATVAASMTDGQGLGVVVDNNSGSTSQVFMQIGGL